MNMRHIHIMFSQFGEYRLGVEVLVVQYQLVTSSTPAAKSDIMYMMALSASPRMSVLLLLRLQAKDFAELAASVAQLSRRVGRVTGAPGALSDTERALAAAQVRHVL